MAEDVIEFGAAGAPERIPRVLRNRPSMESTIPVAGLGAVAGAASLLGPWQTTTYPTASEGRELREVSAALAALGGQGAAYMIALIALVTAVAIALFGQPPVRHTARVAGLALAGSSLALLAGTGYSLTKTSDLADFRLFPVEELNNVSFTPEWGFYIACLSVIAFTVALAMTSTRAPLSVPSSSQEEEEAPDGETELEVSVHPAVEPAPGTDHYQHYMRP